MVIIFIWVIKDEVLLKLFSRIILLLICSTVMTLQVSAAKFFRYTDAAGKTVVSSTLPPEISQQGYLIVNEMGVVLETVSPRKTEQQLLDELKDKARKEEEERLIEEQRNLDTVLLNSYTDISDIERARDNELMAKDRDAMLLKQNIRRLTSMLEDTQTRAARDERLGKVTSKEIQNDVQGFKERIAAEAEEVKKVEKLKFRVNERFTSSIIRFNELKAAEQLRRFRPEELTKGDIKAVIFQCSTSEVCDIAWQAGLRYASEKSTTELAWANESTIMMRKPRKDTDIALMLTRVNSLKGKQASLILEIRCNQTQAGEDLCKSEAVVSIEKDFIPYIQGKVN